MTFHHLTHTTIVELDFHLPEAVRRIAAKVEEFVAARRLAREMDQLDHREIADLAFRR
jgi:hypothetical protein